MNRQIWGILRSSSAFASSQTLNGFSQAQEVLLAAMEKNWLKMFASKLDCRQISGSFRWTNIRPDLSSQEKGLCRWDEWFVSIRILFNSWAPFYGAFSGNARLQIGKRSDVMWCDGKPGLVLLIIFLLLYVRHLQGILLSENAIHKWLFSNIYMECADSKIFPCCCVRTSGNSRNKNNFC